MIGANANDPVRAFLFLKGKETEMELIFGDMVSITHKYKRKTEYRKNSKNGLMNITWKMWIREPYKRSNCIFLGYRNIADGIREYEYEVGYYFYPREYFKVALVCPNDKTNPVYVPLDSILFNNKARLVLSAKEVFHFLNHWSKISPIYKKSLNDLKERLFGKTVNEDEYENNKRLD
jgi:hypothetical protein